AAVVKIDLVVVLSGVRSVNRCIKSYTTACGKFLFAVFHPFDVEQSDESIRGRLESAANCSRCPDRLTGQYLPGIDQTSNPVAADRVLLNTKGERSKNSEGGKQWDLGSCPTSHRQRDDQAANKQNEQQECRQIKKACTRDPEGECGRCGDKRISAEG
ncbi:MAG TPA: hypothetical protein VHL50_06335, partial [Pyrinomonadaceae bacterium]|nr:hypothetical protein [Pyrinomonadaceae bacterium]